MGYRANSIVGCPSRCGTFALSSGCILFAGVESITTTGIGTLGPVQPVFPTGTCCSGATGNGTLVAVLQNLATDYGEWLALLEDWLEFLVEQPPAQRLAKRASLSAAFGLFRRQGLNVVGKYIVY